MGVSVYFKQLLQTTLYKSYFLFVSIEYARPTLMTGELPDDFLRISGDTGTAVAQGQVQYPVFSGFQRAGGLLTITVVQVEWNVLVFSILSLLTSAKSHERTILQFCGKTAPSSL